MTYRVTRFCCTSGMCLECRSVATGRPRKRIVHMTNLDQAKADRVAAGWASYGAKVEPEGSEPG